MRRSRLLPLLLVVSTSLAAEAQSPAAAVAPPAPTCRLALDSLDAKLRTNYAGFLLEVRGARRVAYDSVVAARRREADGTAFAECFAVLDRYVRDFDDPHLFVFQNPSADSAAVARRRAAVRTVPLDEAAVRRDLDARAAALDPVEGIWYDGPVRVAVVRDPAVPGRFVASLLAADGEAWPVGAVRGEFRRVADGRYAARLTDRAFGERQLEATLHRRVLLRLSPGLWGKAYPVPEAERGYLDPVDVHRPHVVVRDRSVVVTMPSHDGAQMRLLDGLVDDAARAIRSRGLLIIDLRGNEGGGSMTSRALHPYVASESTRATPWDGGAPVMLSSPAQVAYAKRFMGTDSSPYVRSLVARLEARPGALVPLDETPPAPRRERALDGDWRVVVLTDRGTVSASEVLVLLAKRSTRATVVGEPTAGALDYQSVQILGLGIGDRRWAFGYPTITAHADLPARGMRGTGITPDVPLVWATVPDAIAEMERRFGR